jgi:hypothetical protein
MQEQNPYSTPGSNLSGQDSFAPGGGVTQGVVEQLAKTKGWTRFAGVLSMLTGGFLILACAAGSSVLNRTGNLQMPKRYIAIGLGFYLLAGGLYLVAGLKLSGFSSAIGRLIYSGKQGDLEDALDRQRSFWQFAGILSIFIGIILIMVMIGLAAQPRFQPPAP